MQPFAKTTLSRRSGHKPILISRYARNPSHKEFFAAKRGNRYPTKIFYLSSVLAVSGALGATSKRCEGPTERGVVVSGFELKT
jgi:hypothetical protein